MPLLQSASLPMFEGKFPSLEHLIATVAEVGFDGIEIWNRDASFAKIVSLAQKHELKFCSMLATAMGLNRRELHGQAEKELRQAIEVAADNNIPGLICFSGDRHEGSDDISGIDNVATVLARVSPFAEEKKITLLLELLNSKVDHPGYQADHTWWGVEVCRKVGSPNVRLLYDIYHMQIMEGDVIRSIRENIQWIGHFHTAGNPGRHEIGSDQELNYGAICNAIRLAGFSGFIGHEFSPLGDPMASLVEARAICAGT